MKSFRKIIWTIVAIQFVFTIICFVFVAPETVITHFGFKGIDSVGPRYMLFLEPICTVISGLLIIWVAKVRRRENGIKENMNVIMPAEGMLLTGHLLIAVIMSVLILDQIGLTHILQLY